MRSIEGYLSRQAQRVNAAAIVTHDDNSAYRMEVPGEDDVGLGDTFQDARRALTALLNATEARRGS